MNFIEPIGRSEDINNAVHKLCNELADMLENEGIGARRLTLTFYPPDGVVERLQAGTSQANRNADHLARLFSEKLDRITATFGIDAITLTATASEKLPPSQATLDRRSEKRETSVAELADRLSNRLGNKNVVRLTLHESHIPERAISSTPSPHAPTRYSYRGD